MKGEYLKRDTVELPVSGHPKCRASLGGRLLEVVANESLYLAGQNVTISV